MYYGNRAQSANEQLLELSRRNNGVTEYKRYDGTTKHKCFLSYYSEDAEEVLGFVNQFSDVFIPKTVGISDDYPLVDSTNDGQVMDILRDDYLADSTVTLVFIGKCTWARKFVDWEIYSSLRKDRVNRLNGLVAIRLPSTAGVTNPKLPSRLNLNVIRDSSNNDIGYARYYSYPNADWALRNYIDDAYSAREDRRELIVLGGSRQTRNSPCS